MKTKKAKGKVKSIGERKAPRAAKKSAARPKNKVDIVKVREGITNLVGTSAKDIAESVIEVAKTGQLASAKYLFEAVGLYPPAEGTAEKAKSESFAETLLKRMGLPTEPGNSEEEPDPLAQLGRMIAAKKDGDESATFTRDAAENEDEGEAAPDEDAGVKEPQKCAPVDAVE